VEVELDTTAGTDDPLELGNLNKLDVVDMLADELSTTDELSANAELDIMKELELVPVPSVTIIAPHIPLLKAPFPTIFFR